MSDLIVSPRTTGDNVSISASIANVGEGAGTVPSAWFLVSKSPDLSSGYFLHEVGFSPTGSGERTLQPGEEGTFEATDDTLGGILLDLERSGTHYGQLWLNPDLSADFANPEGAVEESHSSIESDYENNFSTIVEFERTPLEGLPPSPDCEPDALEENDSLDAAAVVALDTEYTINSCDDWLDVFAVPLDAGQAVEVFVSEEIGNNRWYRTIIAPDGTYVTRNAFSGTSIIQAETTGTYSVVLRAITLALQGRRENVFFVNTVR